MSDLTIYRASAGSGKTFTLTENYLLMLFKNPGLYKNILAVTFTNKATGEMKHRILEELNQLARGEGSAHFASIKKSTNLDSAKIQNQAGQILRSILHDYSRFSVSTIDHFFQRVIRSFSRELGLQSGYTLETDETEILNYIIDELLLATEKDDQLRNWLVNFARSRMMEEKSWNFRNEIMLLAQELTKENVKSLEFSEFNDREKLNEYVKQLKKEQLKFENQMKSYGKQATGLIEKSGLDITHFNNKKSGIARYFYYLKEGRRDKYVPNQSVMKVLDNPDKWPAGKLDKETRNLVVSLANDSLNAILNQAVEFCRNHYERYQTVREIQKNIYVVGILGDIQNRLYDYCREKNLFLISDAADFLKKIISGNDVPFVYEKTGSIYHHFMIDEFQDTSRFQWENFEPLVRNSLSQSYSNLVVGDVKQSIYRWRNGDWKILQDEVHNDFSQYPVRAEYLGYNRRSLSNIVAYNNTIFHFARYVLQNQFDNLIGGNRGGNPWQGKLLETYADVMQKMPDEREGGYVATRFYPHLHQRRQEKLDKIQQQLIRDIEWLQDQQYKLSDIAVIVRKNTEGQEIADAIMEYGKSSSGSSHYKYDVISNDSLYIARAESVKFILALFRYLIKPEDAINRAFIKEVYYSTIKQQEYSAENFHHLVSESKGEFLDFMPGYFGKNLSEIRKMPLYELTERLIDIFEVNKIEGEVPYLQAFQEIVLDYSMKYASDLHSFLEWWNENGIKQKLQLPEDYEAIRVTTIHKVKGLEFKAVLIPYCNWELDTTSSGLKKNYLWCRPDDEILGSTGMVPVNYSDKLEQTFFKDEYYAEKFHNYVDNLNLLYVAFTRAEEVLFSYVPVQVKKDGSFNYTQSNKGISTVGELIHFLYENYHLLPKAEGKVPFIDDLSQYWGTREMVFEWGNLAGRAKQEGSVDSQLKQQKYPVYTTKPELHLRLEHDQFFSEEPDLFQGRIDYGKIMHQVFENIHSREDVEKALEKIYLEGKITHKEKTQLCERIKNLINEPQVREWFSGIWEVYTEREILLPNGGTYRPDRVMFGPEQTVVVDYKFGEKHTRQHNKQIEYYLKQIGKMGYENPVGYIWYVNQNTITKVEV